MRRPIVAGNWKMNTTGAEADALARAVVEGVAGPAAVETVLCPPHPWLERVGRIVDGSPVVLGAQNVHFEAGGAHTGEVSAAMLVAAGCRYCIVGHSERRTSCGETDAIVARKARALLDAGLRAVVCVGETLAEREAGRTHEVVARQVRDSLAGLESRLADVVIAYEPVWAIGTGVTATTEQAQEVHAAIRGHVAELSDAATADGVRIQYGGSVKPGNAAELFACPDIDGGLIGGASLDAASFLAIVAAAG